MIRAETIKATATPAWRIRGIINLLTSFFKKRNFPKMLAAVFLLVWVILAIKPLYRRDWLLENLLVFAVAPLVYYLNRKKYLSPLSNFMIFIFMLMHIIGAHSTYAETPIGFKISDWFGWQRNHYDRIVHFLFGALVTYPVYEIMSPHINASRQWKYVITFSLIFSAGSLYELIEWIAAIIVSPELGTAYLGTQGDEWDAQKDLGLKILGSLLAIGLMQKFGEFEEINQVVATDYTDFRR